MSEFLLLHDNESGGEPATVRKSIISLVLPSEDYSEGSLSLLNLMMEKL